MKQPKQCNNIDEIRNEINRIDNTIIDLLDERFQYVKEVVKYKSNKKEDIIAQKRYDEVISNVRKMAAERNIDPDIIEKIYKILLNYFIDEELKLANNKI